MLSPAASTFCAILQLLKPSCNSTFCAALRRNGGMQGYKTFMAMVTLLSFFMPGRCSSTGRLTCPSSCSTLTNLPFPFGAAPGCGSPGFLLDCSFAHPQWNIATDSYNSSYYIVNISSNPNHSNPEAGSYGYGGSVLVEVKPSPNSTCQVLDAATNAKNDFVSFDLSTFKYADLIYYQDSYLLFNCTESVKPTSGVLLNSSSACAAYLEYCGFSTTTCLEYIPDQTLQLSPFKSVYNCSTRTRFVIPPGDRNVSNWKPYTQVAWGPVNDADSCYACQRTRGICGYSTQDESFLCFCGGKVHQKDCSSGSSKAIDAGVSALSVGILLCFLLGIVFVYRHKCGVFASQRVLKLDGVHEAAVEFPYWALSAATKSFSTKVGQGAFAKVYRGLLHNGNEIAVKILDPSVSYTDEQCLNEVATIGNIHHMNVARLIGFCFTKSKRVLVYEYVSNGSLDKYPFSKQTEAGIPVLSWKQRFEIALGVARGLSYMHEECRQCIIHCDIKPQNILLDAAFRPKIADFGLARLLKREETRVLTHARGTPGYVAPEFWSVGSGPLTAKFDVYSYGIVLLEIIRGRRSFEEFDPFCQEEANFDSFVSVRIDERLEGDANFEQAQMCTRVALWCIQKDPSMRPTMGRVVQFLQGTAAVPDSPPRPFRTVVQREGSPSALLKSSDGSYMSRSCEV